MKHKKNRISWLYRVIIPVVAGAVLLGWFWIAVGNLGSAQGEEGRRQLEEALRRAAVACYAEEGIYPPTLDYLCTHYGVEINGERYNVFYEIFADNLMPDITVLEKGT